ncbi:E3 ubiquitin-protein ligase CCNB1IP1-like protein [Zea mays]|uniref:E3 ubiquitin-protein ligase CCNB1IP1-like protein n=1 Tax=Zea mays TaxID=4577 RepID=A0A1D6FFM1_MAIZE|nr:E3 ubiquitin-protein ligase CCNB1IP1-like protein [Zea mays]
MKPMDINPGDDWTNMAMVGISPQIFMKSAYRSVMFYIGQKELEMQYKMNRIVGHCRQKCELMQAKFTEKLEEVSKKIAHSLVAGSVDLPKTPGQRDKGWGPPPRQRHCTSGPFDLSTGSPAHAVAPPADIRPRQQTRSVFGATCCHQMEGDIG